MVPSWLARKDDVGWGKFPLVAPREFLTEQRKEFKHVPELESKKSL